MNRRVAILCEFATLNGGERSLLSTLPIFTGSDWSPVVLCPSAGALPDALAQRGVPTLRFEMRFDDGSPRPREALRVELAMQLRGTAPNLVHANSLSTARLSGPVVRELGIPSIGHLRDIVSLSRPAVADLNSHARLLAVSAATKASHVAQGVSDANTHVLYNGVDLEAFSPRSPGGRLHDELALARSIPLIGCIGQISLRKGQDVLVNAARRLAERYPTLHYVFIGVRHSDKLETRQFEEHLRAAFHAPPLDGRGHFLGTRNDVAQLLPELTLLAHPARQEPLGRVLLEAAACGCAIVATAVGGTPEIFRPQDDAALLVPPDRPDALAAAMAQLLDAPELRRTLGANARRRAESVFSAATSAAGLLEHYNDVDAG